MKNRLWIYSAFTFFLIFQVIDAFNVALAQDAGSLDLSFYPGTGADNTILAAAIQNDGRIIIGGVFKNYDGTSINHVARLNVDGSLDNSFNPGTGFDWYVFTTMVQNDGKIILAGAFTSYNEIPSRCIVRLNVDASLDETFNIGSGANNSIFTTAMQSDGKIIIGGAFTSFNGNVRSHIARLSVDGSLDETFNIGSGLNNNVNAVAVQSDGKIILAGDFTSYNGTSMNGLARLNIDGSLDETFNPNLETTETYLDINTIAIQNDGKLVIAGKSFCGGGKSIARLNTDGSNDEAFDSNPWEHGPYPYVYTAVFQNDGKIIVGGQNISCEGMEKGGIVRLDTDGDLDGTFDLDGAFGNNTSAVVRTTVIQNDGKIIIGGRFESYDGIPTNSICRLHSSPVGVGNEVISEFSLFPNPASNTVTLTLPQNMPRTLMILRNMLGQEILRVGVTAGPNEIALDGLVSTIYTLHVGGSTQRLIVE